MSGCLPTTNSHCAWPPTAHPFLLNPSGLYNPCHLRSTLSHRTRAALTPSSSAFPDLPLPEHRVLLPD